MNGEMNNGSQKRAKLSAGRAWLEIVALSAERLLLEIYAPGALPTDRPIAAFPFEYENLEKVLRQEGAIQIETPDGNLMVRASGDNLWLVYGVTAPSVQDSCLIPKADFQGALNRLHGPTVL